MLNTHATPHVSAALVHLRRSVTALAAVTMLCLVVQTLVFGFVRFTDARIEVIEPDVAPAPAVVAAEPTPAELTARGQLVGQHAKAAKPEPMVVPSRWDGVMREFSSVASAAGAIAAVMMAAQVLGAVAVAGGGAVPGVHRVVSASTWSLVTALVCLPWNDLMPSMPFTGVFSGYSALVSADEAADAGRTAAWLVVVNHVVLPMLGVPLCMYVAHQLREGVRAGVLVTSVSDLDRRVEAEIAALAAQGVGSNFGPRSVGALHTALGEAGDATASKPLGTPALERMRDAEQEAALETLARRAKLKVEQTRSIGRPDPGSAAKRPI